MNNNNNNEDDSEESSFVRKFRDNNNNDFDTNISDEKERKINLSNNLNNNQDLHQGEFENFIRKSLGGSFTEASLISCLGESDIQDLSQRLLQSLTYMPHTCHENDNSSGLCGNDHAEDDVVNRNGDDDSHVMGKRSSTDVITESAVRIKTAVSFLVDWIQTKKKEEAHEVNNQQVQQQNQPQQNQPQKNQSEQNQLQQNQPQQNQTQQNQPQQNQPQQNQPQQNQPQQNQPQQNQPQQNQPQQNQPQQNQPQQNQPQQDQNQSPLKQKDLLKESELKLQLQQAISAYDHVTLQLQREITQKQSLNLDLMQTKSLFAGCQEELKSCQEKIKVSEANKEVMVVDLERMRNQLEVFKLGQEEVDAKTADLNRQKESLMKNVDEAFKEVFEENSKLSEECRQLTRRMVHDRQLFDAQLKELEVSNEQLSNQLDKIRDEAGIFANDAQLRIASLDKQLRHEKKFSLDQSSEREEERDTYQERIDKLKQALEETERLNQAHLRMKDEIQGLEEQVRDKTDYCQQLLHEKDQAKVEMNKQTQIAMEMNEAIRGLEIELSERCKKEKELIKKFEEDLQDLERLKRIPSVRKRLEKMKKFEEEDDDDDSDDGDSAERIRLVGEVAVLKSEAKKAEVILKESREAEKEIQGMNKGLQEQVASIQKSLKDLQLDKDSLEGQLLQQSNTISSLRNSAEGRGVELMEVGEVARLKAKLQEVKDILEAKDKEIHELNTKALESTEQMNSLQDRVEALEGEERSWWVDKDRMQTLVDTLNSKCADYKTKLLEKEKEESRKNMNILHEALMVEKNNYIDELTNQIQDLINKVTHLTNENKAIKSDVTKLKTEISSFENTFYGKSKSSRLYHSNHSESLGSPDMLQRAESTSQRPLAFDAELDGGSKRLGDKSEHYHGDTSMVGVGVFRDSVGEYQIDNSPTMTREGDSMRPLNDNSQLLRIAEQIQDIFSHYTVASIQELDDLLKKHQQQNNVLNNKLQLEKAANESLVDSINHLKVEIEESMAANDNELEVLSEDLKAKEFLIGQLNMQLHETRDFIASQQQHMDAVAEENATEAKKLCVEKNRLIEEIKKKETQMTMKKKEMDEMKKGTDEMAAELKNHVRLLEKKLVEKEDCVGKLERTQADLKLKSEDRLDELKSCQGMIRNMETVAVENRLMIEKLKGDLQETSDKEISTRRQLEERVKKLLGELNEKMAEGKALKEDVLALKKRLHEATLKHDELCLSLDRLSSEKRTELESQKLLHEDELLEVRDELKKKLQEQQKNVSLQELKKKIEQQKQQLEQQRQHHEQQVNELKQLLQQDNTRNQEELQEQKIKFKQELLTIQQQQKQQNQQQSLQQQQQEQNIQQTLQKQLQHIKSLQQQHSKNSPTPSITDEYTSFNTTTTTTQQDITVSYEELSGDLQIILGKLHLEAMRVLSLTDCKFLEGLEKKAEEVERLRERWSEEKNDLVKEIMTVKGKADDNEKKSCKELDKFKKLYGELQERYKSLEAVYSGRDEVKGAEDVDVNKLNLALQQEKCNNEELYNLLKEERRLKTELSLKEEHLLTLVSDLQATIDLERAHKMARRDEGVGGGVKEENGEFMMMKEGGMEKRFKRDIEKLKRMLQKAENDRASSETKLLLQAQELVSTNEQRDFLQNQLTDIKNKLNSIELQLKNEKRKIELNENIDEVMILHKNLALLKQKIQLLSEVSTEYMEGMIPNTQQPPHNIDSTTSETTIKDLITDILSDVERVQTITKSTLTNPSILTKSSSNMGVSSQNVVIAESEFINDRILVHNAQLTQRIYDMAGELRHLKQAQRQTGFCNPKCNEKFEKLNNEWLLEEKKWRESNEVLIEKLLAMSSQDVVGDIHGHGRGFDKGESRAEVRLRADKQALQSQSNPVVADKEKVQKLYGKYLRAEAFRKSLIYQKKYLLFLLGDFKQSEEATLAAIAKLTATARAGNKYQTNDDDVIRTLNTSCPSLHPDQAGHFVERNLQRSSETLMNNNYQQRNFQQQQNNNYQPQRNNYSQHQQQQIRGVSKFRTAVRVIISILRLKFLVKKWQRATKMNSSWAPPQGNPPNYASTARRRIEVGSVETRQNRNDYAIVNNNLYSMKVKSASSLTAVNSNNDVNNNYVNINPRCKESFEDVDEINENSINENGQVVYSTSNDDFNTYQSLSKIEVNKRLNRNEKRPLSLNDPKIILQVKKSQQKSQQHSQQQTKQQFQQNFQQQAYQPLPSHLRNQHSPLRQQINNSQQTKHLAKVNSTPPTKEAFSLECSNRDSNYHLGSIQMLKQLNNNNHEVLLEPLDYSDIDINLNAYNGNHRGHSLNNNHPDHNKQHTNTYSSNACRNNNTNSNFHSYNTFMNDRHTDNNTNIRDDTSNYYSNNINDDRVNSSFENYLRRLDKANNGLNDHK